MNRSHRSPEDLPAGEPDQLAQIERQLQNWQPRRAELDIEMIMRKAREVDGAIVLSARSEQGEATDRQGRQRRSLRWIAIAGSWACGAVAGALMTFVLLSREASSETPNVEKNPPNSVIPRFVDIEEDATSSGRTENVQRDESPMIVRRSRSDAFISNVLLDPYSRSTAYFDEQWPQLRAGSFVRLQGTESAPRESWRSFGTQPSDPPGTQDSGNTTQDRQKRSAPSPPMTRERLLKELLGVSASSLL